MLIHACSLSCKKKIYEKSNLLINLFSELPGSFLTAQIDRKLNFAFICLIGRFLGAGRCSFMPILCLGSHWAAPGSGFPLGIPGYGVPIGVAPGYGVPIGPLLVRASGPLGPWDPPRDPGPLGPP